MVSTTTKIGFIGTGVMGKSMANNLMKSGFPISIFNRTKEKANELIENGATWKNTVKELVEDTTIIITMVGEPIDVEEIYFGENGIIENAKEKTIIIDMTTSKPSLAKTIYEKALAKNIFALDAPVSGGDVGAKNGKLSIMIGGDKSIHEQVQPVFKAMGENIIYHGPAGSGQHAKLANQITVASTMIGVVEAIVYAKRAGLNPTRVIDTISTGAGSTFAMGQLGPRMLKGDFSPGFYVKHFIKDLKIALESAEEMDLNTPGLSLSLELYQELAEKGEADSGTQALIKLFESSN